MAVLLVILFVLAAMTAAYILNGWALQLLWQWFIVPFGVVPLTLPWAIGISIVVGFLTNHITTKKNEEVDMGKVWLTVFLRPFIAVIIGWLVHQFMVNS